MDDKEREMANRINQLERRVSMLCRLAGALCICLLAGLLLGTGPGEVVGAAVPKPRELVVSKLTLVDDEGKTRLVLGQDPKDVNRIARSAGLTLFDNKGAERGGFATMDDGSVVLAMDAPVGVGKPMRDRIGLKVFATGSAEISLLGNNALIPVRLITDAEGSGGIEFLDYDLPNKKAFIKRTNYQGESKSETNIGYGIG